MQNFYLFQLLSLSQFNCRRTLVFILNIINAPLLRSSLHSTDPMHWLGYANNLFFDQHMAHFKSPCTKTQFTLKLGCQVFFKKMQQNQIDARTMKIFNFIDILNELLDTQNRLYERGRHIIGWKVQDYKSQYNFTARLFYCLQIIAVMTWIEKQAMQNRCLFFKLLSLFQINPKRN